MFKATRLVADPEVESGLFPRVDSGQVFTRGQAPAEGSRIDNRCNFYHFSPAGADAPASSVQTIDLLLGPSSIESYDSLYPASDTDLK